MHDDGNARNARPSVLFEGTCGEAVLGDVAQDGPTLKKRRVEEDCAKV